jgi:hypothetical protein
VSFPFYFDEDQNVRIAARLSRAGFDVLTARDAGRAGRGVSDEDHLRFAAELGRALVTTNARDFAPIFDEWWQKGRNHAGIILVSPQKSADVIYHRLLRLQELYANGISNLILQA